VHRLNRPHKTPEPLSRTTPHSLTHAHVLHFHTYLYTNSGIGIRMGLPRSSTRGYNNMYTEIMLVLRVRVRDASPYIMGISICVRVCCLRSGEGSAIREFVIFQFLCIPWGTAKSRQTVCAELARDAVVCPSLSPTSPNAWWARCSKSFEVTWMVGGERFSFRAFFSRFGFG